MAARLIAADPLAWVISRRFNASPLPLLAEYGESGEVSALFGHCAIGNPLCADFAEDPAGLILFNGPDGYISPQLVSSPDWGPTWNYAALRFTVEMEFRPQETRASVERLLVHFEGDGEGRWTTANLGPRYERMLEHIVAFRAHVRTFQSAFKLGQDESEAVFEEITSRHPDRTLAAWMREFVKERE